MNDLDLARFDNVFAEAPADEEPVPDGKYQVNVEKVELTRSKTADNPMLKWELRILSPDHVGRYLWRHNMLVSEENVGWLKKDLHRAGLDLEKLSDLPRRLEELLDAKLEVTKRTTGDNENVYINKRLHGSVDEGTAGGSRTF